MNQPPPEEIAQTVYVKTPLRKDVELFNLYIILTFIMIGMSGKIYYDLAVNAAFFLTVAVYASYYIYKPKFRLTELMAILIFSAGAGGLVINRGLVLTGDRDIPNAVLTMYCVFASVLSGANMGTSFAEELGVTSQKRRIFPLIYGWLFQVLSILLVIGAYDFIQAMLELRRAYASQSQIIKWQAVIAACMFLIALTGLAPYFRFRFFSKKSAQ